MINKDWQRAFNNFLEYINNKYPQSKGLQFIQRTTWILPCVSAWVRFFRLPWRFYCGIRRSNKKGGWNLDSGEEMVLQDSAGFHEFPQMMADVRTCLTKMNIRVVELPEPERLANCAFDGAKPYAPPSPFHKKKREECQILRQVTGQELQDMDGGFARHLHPSAGGPGVDRHPVGGVKGGTGLHQGEDAFPLLRPCPDGLGPARRPCRRPGKPGPGSLSQ